MTTLFCGSCGHLINLGEPRDVDAIDGSTLCAECASRFGRVAPLPVKMIVVSTPGRGIEPAESARVTK